MPRPVQFAILAALFCPQSMLTAKEQSVGVYIALCDNEHQGIVPVPAAIGNGDDPDRNLYWGAGEGIKGYFDRSKAWKVVNKPDGADGKAEDKDVLRTRTYRRAAPEAVLYARAYRGSALKRCIQDFESAVQLGAYDVVVYIGHNGLMDFDLPEPKKSGRQAKVPDCIVLCCKSEKYFGTRLRAAGGRPILLTTQFMYPGSFILHAVLDDWLAGADLTRLREAAGKAYAKNQRLTTKAGLGVFADLAKAATSRPSIGPAPGTTSRPYSQSHGPPAPGTGAAPGLVSAPGHVKLRRGL
jgi:hypothetical protein